MKFLMSEDGYDAVNVAFIKEISLIRVTFPDGAPPEIRAVAEFDTEGDEDDFILRTFDWADEEENLAEARAYLADLVDQLNGGAK